MSKEQGITKRPSNNPNGRPKGALNKRTRAAIDLFDELDFCPLKQIVERLKKYGETMDEKLYLDTCAKLAKFKFSELKSVDHTVNPRELSNSELIEETKAILSEVGVLE